MHGDRRHCVLSSLALGIPESEALRRRAWCIQSTLPPLQAPWHSSALPARGWGQKVLSVDGRPSKAGVTGGLVPMTSNL